MNRDLELARLKKEKNLGLFAIIAFGPFVLYRLIFPDDPLELRLPLTIYILAIIPLFVGRPLVERSEKEIKRINEEPEQKQDLSRLNIDLADPHNQRSRPPLFTKKHIWWAIICIFGIFGVINPPTFEESDQEYYERLQKEAQTNDPVAQYYLALAYRHGIGTETNYKKAIEYYVKSSENGFRGGNPETTLGWWYLTGPDPSIPTDYKKAFYWNKLGMEHGHTNAASNLACMYWTGKGVTQNSVTAIEHTIKAIELYEDEKDSWIRGVDNSEVCLKGVTSIPSEFTKAKRLFYEAINSDNPTDKVPELRELQK